MGLMRVNLFRKVVFVFCGISARFSKLLLLCELYKRTGELDKHLKASQTEMHCKALWKPKTGENVHSIRSKALLEGWVSVKTYLKLKCHWFMTDNVSDSVKLMQRFLFVEMTLTHHVGP